MKELLVFDFKDKKIRARIIDGEPWWIATDITDILGIDHTQTRRIDDDEKGLYIIQTPGEPQKRLFINESGLYSLILSSKKPEAKFFKRWVTHEVLPSIRKTGQYSVQDNDDEIIMLGFKKALERVKLLKDENSVLKPKAEVHDRIYDAEGLHAIKEAADILGIGEKTFFALLRDEGILFYCKTEKKKINLPKAEYIKSGYFKVKEKPFSVNGSEYLYPRVYVTGKGLTWLTKKFGRKNTERPA
ncbi:MAG: phage antirepressor KilAC domain-containing protein [Spirochaetales bacterium]|nr:phage antirepressor KilAC domain-containing protein [Spirochaetales bacterium]